MFRTDAAGIESMCTAKGRQPAVPRIVGTRLTFVSFPLLSIQSISQDAHDTYEDAHASLLVSMEQSRRVCGIYLESPAAHLLRKTSSVVLESV